MQPSVSVILDTLHPSSSKDCRAVARALGSRRGVSEVRVRAGASIVEVIFDRSLIALGDIVRLIEDAGRVVTGVTERRRSRDI